MRASQEPAMYLTAREFWTVIHGMVLGAIFLLAFAGGVAELLGLRAEYETPSGLAHAKRRLISGTWLMAVIAWLTVFTGTFGIYIWYRAAPPAGADLADFPRSFLLSRASTEDWHNLGMEWKEHVAWLSPILATAVAFVVTRYRSTIAQDRPLRQALMAMFVMSFVTAAIAGIFGAFINKVAPIH
jgi:hypothetical protein